MLNNFIVFEIIISIIASLVLTVAYAVIEPLMGALVKKYSNKLKFFLVFALLLVIVGAMMLQNPIFVKRIYATVHHMVSIPSGEFLMGNLTDGEGFDDESPYHSVYLDSFWIDKTEVTNAQYQKCVDAGACQPPMDYVRDRSAFNKPNHPVVGVSWVEANAYCQWIDMRLPTEAEWEKAARGTDGRKYPWGDEWDVRKTKRLNFADKNTDYPWSDNKADDGYKYTSPVGSYPAGTSPYGALDMAGNVWEWVADWYDAHYYAQYPASNPTGPATGTHRVFRGGSWKSKRGDVRTTTRFFREKALPIYPFDNVGFRCALSP